MPSFSFAVLRLRDFRLLLLVRVFINLGMYAMDVIIGWQVYSLTHSAFILGLTGLAEAVPAIACALFAGHIVDVGRPYVIFRTCTGVLLLNIMVMTLVGGSYVDAPGGILFWLFTGIFMSGLTRSFFMPSLFSLLPQIISREQMSSSSAWLTSSFQLGVIVGPAIAGLVYGGYGVRAAWMLPASLITIGFILLLAISDKPRRYKSEQKRERAVKSIKAGWHFILRNPVLLSVMTLDMFAVLFGGAVAMLPVFADQILHVGSEGLGALRSAPAIGAIAAALWFAVKPFKQIRATQLLWAVVGFGVCMIGFGLSTSFWLSMGILILSGAFDSVSMVIRSTLMQWLTTDDMRGRVSSVNSMFIISSNEIGAFESGAAAGLLGLVPSVVLGGVMTLVVVAVTAAVSPKFRKTSVNANDATH